MQIASPRPQGSSPDFEQTRRMIAPECGADAAASLLMYSLDAIESINFEQLATATDRMLLRGRPSKRRTLTAAVHRVPTRPASVRTSTTRRSEVMPVAVVASLVSVTAMIVALF